ncbi:MAG TPA: EVE domain-containing protein [Tepidiformaceae bacterium]|nr:EVE domain-containing protein [Tepidiformaceae bacterium]
MARYWIVVGGPEIFAKTRELGFSRHGFKSTRRRMAGEIAPGDRVAFYITGRKQFAGSVEVTSPMVEEQTRIWQSDKKPGEMYPYRVGIKPVTILEQDDWLDAEPYHERFSWTQKWPRKNWTLAYQGNLHEIPKADFDILEKDLKKAAKRVAAPA